jgi:hypothetical protein
MLTFNSQGAIIAPSVESIVTAVHLVRNVLKKGWNASAWVFDIDSIMAWHQGAS